MLLILVEMADHVVPFVELMDTKEVPLDPTNTHNGAELIMPQDN